jgi:hypothetical protein
LRHSFATHLLAVGYDLANQKRTVDSSFKGTAAWSRLALRQMTPKGRPQFQRFKHRRQPSAEFLPLTHNPIMIDRDFNERTTDAESPG